MNGGRAMSDASVPKLVDTPVRDSTGKMKELLTERQNSSYGGADQKYHIAEDFSVYEQFPEHVCRVQMAAERGDKRRWTQCSSYWAGWWIFVAVVGYIFGSRFMSSELSQ
jgi:hypothetical protein